MKHFTILSFILFFLFSCQEKERKPTHILSREEFTAFLIEMYLAEARMDLLPISKDSAIKLFMPHEKKLLEKLSVKDSTLKKTYQYYFDHPKEMEAVFDVVIDTLNLREQRIK
jgi:hypothetical protein